MSKCPLCMTNLGNDDNVTRWVHDLVNHREYWKGQTENMTKDQLNELLFEIVDYYHKREVNDK